jgi:hypothetical protein
MKKRTIASPNTASVNLNGAPFNAPAKGLALTTATYDAGSLKSSQKGQVTITNPQTLNVLTQGGAVQLTIGVVDSKGAEDYFPIGMFMTGQKAQTGVDNFPKCYVQVSDGTLTFIDTCTTAKKSFEFYIVVQRQSDNAVAIIDPGISHDGATLGGGRGRK